MPNKSPTQRLKFRNQVCQKNLVSLWEYYFLNRLDRMKKSVVVLAAKVFHPAKYFVGIFFNWPVALIQVIDL
ncbi:hypothetical protein THIOM_005111 [Candidatus Thiomargarita nelsonii]|uniref:Uncharacterized protein n=1 Tax=Candidatus Thiomargarita nelsonii TaxID=1003181 RepID=A0A176RU62_9GAMM|nr:hypothetical protein THIOM_005111 [Candidatus Thiomargarita nelsonii]